MTSNRIWPVRLPSETVADLKSSI